MCCMDQHAAHNTQHTAHTHAVGTVPSEHAIALSTLCDDGGAAAVRQMWHYNDLDVLSGPDYLGSECEAKLAFALLHGADPRLVTLSALHRAGITVYRQLFATLSEHSPLPEQRWIDMVMQQRGQAPGPSFVPFEASATPQSVNFGATAEDSELTEVPADPDLGCDDRPLTYRRGDDEPDADGSERHRLLLLDSSTSGVVQSFVCTTLPTKTHRCKTW